MWNVLKFELGYQWRQPLFLILALVLGLLTFFGMASEEVTIGGGTNSLNLNAAFVILQTHLIMSVILMFAAAAFAALPIIRDFDSRTAEMVFSSGVSPRQYLLGRFLGGWFYTFVVGVIMVVFSLLATLMPWLDPERIGDFSLAPFTWALLVIYLPTSFFLSALFFSIAAVTRSMLLSYVGVMLLLVLFIVLGVNTDQETIHITSALEPFGFLAFGAETRYWPVFERNTMVPAFDGALLVSRLLWCGIGLAVLLLTTAAYRFKLPSGGKARKKVARPGVAPNSQVLVSAKPRPGLGSIVTQFSSQLRMDLRGVFKSYAVYIVLAFALFNVLGSFIAAGGQLYGTDVLPTTGAMMRSIAGSFTFLVFAIVVFYSGELVFRERDTRVFELTDSTNVPGGVTVLSKFLTLVLVIVALLAVAVLTAIVVQVLVGSPFIDLTAYLKGVFLYQAWDLYIVAALAILIQVLAPNKQVGMLGVIVVVIALMVISSFGFEHNLYLFGTPNVPHSDMNGFGHFPTAFWWFALYWAAVCTVLMVIAHLLFDRGVASNWGERLAAAKQRMTPGALGAGVLALAAAIGLGSWIFYNTNIVNTYLTSKDREAKAAEYELAYKQYEDMPQLQGIDVDVEVDIFPTERRLESRGRYLMENVWDEPVSELVLSVAWPMAVNSLDVPGARLVESSEEFGFFRYEFDEPVRKGEQRTLSWDFSWLNPGFENSGSTTRLVYNGTFVDNFEIMPLPGYNPSNELTDNNVRRQYDLPPAERAPKMGDPEALKLSQLGVARRVAYRATVSTIEGQIAVSPGYLQRDWVEDGRHFFEYEMDQPIAPFFSFQSAEYAVASDQWNDVAIEVFYHPEHDANIESMIRGTKKSLDYFTQAFSPYQFKQFRILEFPRYASFAQSFPNTIPFSEEIGFTADLSDENDIDYVFYVTAHELAHQWWAHQAIGANMQGSTMIVETLAQYSALMAMEREYGAEKMRRFLKYELDVYLSRRGGELIEELPVAYVENQGYIHYRKGSVVMYALKDAIGEDNVNLALRRFLEKYAFKNDPFPTALDLVAEFRAVAGPEHQRLITDLFEKIMLFDLEVEEATYEALGDGRYQVSFTASVAQFEADGEGAETEVEADIELELAVFGESDSEYGGDDLPAPLVLKRQRLTTGEHTFTFEVDELPKRVGIDPYVKMVDRNPDNNLSAVQAARP